MIDWFYIKIAGRVDKKFAMKSKVEQVILKIVINNRVDGVNKLDKVDQVDEFDRVDN